MARSHYDGAGQYELTDSYIYISHLDEGLQYWRIPTLPDSISDNMSVSFPSTPAMGRSAPVFTYSNSGPRTLQVAINLHRDMMNDINMNWSNAKLGYGEDYVDNFIHALMSIAVPKYNLNNKAIEPALVAARFGKECFIKGVVSGSVGVVYELPILENDRYASIKISFSISEVDPYDSKSIYTNGSFRGEVRTFREGAASVGVGTSTIKGAIK